MRIKRLRPILEEFSQLPLPGLPMYTGIPNSTGGVSSLPFDAWDNSVHGLKSPLDALKFSMNSLLNDPEFMNYMNGNSDLEKVQNLTITRVVKNEENMRLDVHIKMMIDNNDYWGIIQNYDKDPIFKSELEAMPIRKETMIRLKGFILKVLNKWFRPIAGSYRTLTEIITRDWLGKKWTIHKGSLITVLENQDWDINKIVKIRCKGNDVYLDKEGYYFFKYWCEKI